jgi:hypothetical protein
MGLGQIISQTKPDIVHSMDIEEAGYLTYATEQRMSSFPTWITSNWSSAPYTYHRVAAYQEHLIRLLANCDYCTTECQRDVELAQELGLKAKVLPVISNAGGFDIARWQNLCQPVPTSRRKVILLKGRQHWSGRALAGLRAIEMCADVLLEKRYSVLIQLASPDVPLAAELVAYATGIPIKVVPEGKYEDAMRRFSVARIHIGLSAFDSMEQSLLEAMVMRAFPIQSSTPYASEWIEDGKGGLLVPSGDPHIIAEALHRAIKDDNFVDQAVTLNDATARQRLDYAQVKRQTVEMYESVLKAK